MIKKWKEAPKRTKKILIWTFSVIYVLSILGEFITEKLEIKEFVIAIFIGGPLAAGFCTLFMAMSIGSIKETFKDHRPEFVKSKPGGGKIKAAIPYIFAAIFAIAYIVDHLYTRVYTPY